MDPTNNVRLPVEEPLTICLGKTSQFRFTYISFSLSKMYFLKSYIIHVVIHVEYLILHVCFLICVFFAFVVVFTGPFFSIRFFKRIPGVHGAPAT